MFATGSARKEKGANVEGKGRQCRRQAFARRAHPSKYRAFTNDFYSTHTDLCIVMAGLIFTAIGAVFLSIVMAR